MCNLLVYHGHSNKYAVTGSEGCYFLIYSKSIIMLILSKRLGKSMATFLITAGIVFFIIFIYMVLINVASRGNVLPYIPARIVLLFLSIPLVVCMIVAVTYYRFTWLKKSCVEGERVKFILTKGSELVHKGIFQSRNNDVAFIKINEGSEEDIYMVPFEIQIH